MSLVRFPEGYLLEPLRRDHPRNAFRSGATEVDDWLAQKAYQHQQKHLSRTKVLLDESRAIAGYYTLAIGEVECSALPEDIVKSLPDRGLPVALLAWLGTASHRQKQGLGRLLLGQALSDCHEAGKTFAFIAVVLDCLNDAAKAFYSRWPFREFPSNPNRLFLIAKRLDAIVMQQ